MTTVASTEQTGLDGSQTITVRGSASGFAQEITIGPHRLRADEPMSIGGTNTGPNPYDLLLAAPWILHVDDIGHVRPKQALAARIGDGPAAPYESVRG